MGYYPRSMSIWLRQQSQPSLTQLNYAEPHSNMPWIFLHPHHIHTVCSYHGLAPTVWALQCCPWWPQATAISCPLNGHSTPAAQSLRCWVLLSTNESLKFPVISGSEALCPPLFSNHTRPSAQCMEIVVQNLVSWLILSVVLSNVL